MAARKLSTRTCQHVNSSPPEHGSTSTHLHQHISLQELCFCSRILRIFSPKPSFNEFQRVSTRVSTPREFQHTPGCVVYYDALASFNASFNALVSTQFQRWAAHLSTDKNEFAARRGRTTPPATHRGPQFMSDAILICDSQASFVLSQQNARLF